MQRQRYRLYRRTNGTFYAQDNDTGKQTSLNTKERGEAAGLLAAKNQSSAQPVLNVAMAKVYLSAKSPELLTRTPGTMETSRPGIFAAGDVRSGSVKRCAAAVGEGGMAVEGIHQALGTY